MERTRGIRGSHNPKRKARLWGTVTTKTQSHCHRNNGCPLASPPGAVTGRAGEHGGHQATPGTSEEGAGVLRERERLVVDEPSHWETMHQGGQGKRWERFLFLRP